MSYYLKPFCRHCLSHVNLVLRHPAEPLTALGTKLISSVFSSMSTSMSFHSYDSYSSVSADSFSTTAFLLLCEPPALLPELPSELWAPNTVRSPKTALDVSETLNPSASAFLLCTVTFFISSLCLCSSFSTSYIFTSKTETY